MKKWLIALCLVAIPVCAQEISGDFFSDSNPNLIRDSEAQTFTGESLVYIQGISDKPQPKTWMDNVKIRLFGSMEVPNGPQAPNLTNTPSLDAPQNTENGVFTKDFFGSSRQIKYTPHTSNWDFIIQPINTKTVSIQENIQFLLTQETPIVRSWPTTRQNIDWIKVQLDNRHIPVNQQQQSRLDFGILPAGLHQINLHYTLVSSDPKNFVLPLVGDNWPLVTDVLSGVILNGKIKLEQSHFLLGQNNMEIPQNFIFQSDEQGNTFFRNNHILPEFTQIQLSSQVSDLAPQYDTVLFSVSAPMIFFLVLIVILIYFILSACEVYFASLPHLLKKFKYIGKTPLSRYFYRTGEIIIGSFLLLFLTGLTTVLIQIPLGWKNWIGLLLLVIIGVITVDIFVFLPKQKMVQKIYNNQTKKDKK